jgi:hypothetical protein
MSSIAFRSSIVFYGKNFRHTFRRRVAPIAHACVESLESRRLLSTVYGNTADAQITSATTSPTANPMMCGYSGNTAMDTEFVFQLPVLPAGQMVSSASLSIFYDGKTSSPTYNGDLYGLHYRSSATVQVGDFYVGASDPHATLIQTGFTTPALPNAGQHIGTSSSGNANLASYLNAQYNTGATSGSYVFLRVNPDTVLSNNYTRYLFDSAETAGQYYQPQLNITLAPATTAWSNVQLQGGGYVTGLVANPQGTIYARTDIGGAYRWNASDSTWSPLTDWQTKANLYGIDSIAIDPNNVNTVWIACGQYEYNPGQVYVSRDQGATFTPTNLTVPAGSNDTSNCRYGGERLMVDPHNSNIVYYGTRNNGLYKYNGTSWSQVTGFPTLGDTNKGLAFVAFDGTGSVVGGVTQTIYVGVDSATAGGIYRSTDGGSTWTKMGGVTLTSMDRGTVGSDGTLWVTYPGGVSKMARGSTTLTAVTPSGQGAAEFSAVAVDPANASEVVVAERNGSGSNIPMYFTTNGGSTWTQVAYSEHNSGATRLSSQWFEATSQVLFNPTNTSELWAADFLGPMRTDNFSPPTAGSDWYNAQAGVEEACPFALISPPSGAPLLTGVADVDGFVSNSLTTPPSAQFGTPNYVYTSGLDYSQTNPSVIARVVGNANGSYSTNDGASFTFFGSDPTWTSGSTNYTAHGGRIAVSSGSSTNFVWAPESWGPLFYTTNSGTTWTQATGTGAASPVGGEWGYQGMHCLVADRNVSGKFYEITKVSGGIQIAQSTNGGATWTVPAGATIAGNPGYSFTVESAYGVSGAVWVAFPGVGLFTSTDGGQTFAKLAAVTSINTFAFGAHAPGLTNPAVFISGTVSQGGTTLSGILRSDDMGQTWVQASTSAQTFGTSIPVMEGDWQQYGTVFVGSNGRGVFVGQFSLTGQAPVGGAVALLAMVNQPAASTSSVSNTSLPMTYVAPSSKPTTATIRPAWHPKFAQAGKLAGPHHVHRQAGDVENFASIAFNMFKADKNPFF